MSGIPPIPAYLVKDDHVIGKIVGLEYIYVLSSEQLLLGVKPDPLCYVVRTPTGEIQHIPVEPDTDPDLGLSPLHIPEFKVVPGTKVRFEALPPEEKPKPKKKRASKKKTTTRKRK